MKVIVSAVAFLALLPLAHSASEDKEVTFLSLKEHSSDWLSDRPVSLYVIPAEKPPSQEDQRVYRKTREGPTRPLLDFPGPGYDRMREGGHDPSAGS
jgi:hypothetical protein